MGVGAAPQAVGDPVRVTPNPPDGVTRLSIFPLSGALLFPGLRLPLHIFEPRYRALVSDAMARDRRIGMIQPKVQGFSAPGDPPPLFEVGTVGRIADVEMLEDGRSNIVLEGVARFRVVRELPVATLFRQVEAELIEEGGDALAAVVRASLEQEARRFAEAHGYLVDWSQVGRLDDESLVNGIAQIAPFDSAAKQALLETDALAERAELTIQLLQFFGRHDGDDLVTLQ